MLHVSEIPPRKALVGRDEAVAEIVDLLQPGIHTILGPAGVGKTSVLVEILHRLRTDQRSVAFIPLESATSGDDLLRQVAAVLDLLVSDDLAAQIQHALSEQPDLVLGLDNFEQVENEGAQIVANWRDAIPDLTVIVTSRHPLEQPHERRIPLLPLEPANALTLLKLCASERGVALEEDDEALELMQSLDGLPLSIELAAARTTVLSLREIRDRIAANPNVLKDPKSVRAPRQRSIDLALAWSWDLLNEDEKHGFVFLGHLPSTISAAAFEAAFDDGLDLLQSLIDKSLVRVQSTKFGRRFSVYHVMRAFCQNKGIDIDAQLVQFRAFYAKKADAFRVDFSGTEGGVAVKECRESEITLRFGLDGATEEQWKRIAFCLDDMFEILGPQRARIDLLKSRELEDDTRNERLAAAYLDTGEIELARPHVERSKNDWVRARFLKATGDDEAAIEFATEATQSTDRRTVARAKSFLAWTDLENQTELLKGAAEIYEQIGDRRALARARLNLGVAWMNHGDLLRAAQEQSTALDEAERLSDAKLKIAARTNRALILHQLRDHTAALSDLEIAAESARAVGLFPQLGTIRGNLGALLLNEGRGDEAERTLISAVSLLERYGVADGARYAEIALATLHHESGQPAKADGLYRSLMSYFDSTSHPTVHAEVCFLSALLFWELKQRDEVLDLIRSAFQHENSQWATLARAAAWRFDPGVFEKPTPEVGQSVIVETANALIAEEPLPVDWIVARILTGLITEENDESGEALLLGDACGWFEFRNERVDMMRRGAPRKILQAFVDHHGKPLDVNELFDFGWPGQTIDVDAANKRVYSAIRTLRRLGLEDAIVTLDDGYALSAAVRIRFS